MGAKRKVGRPRKVNKPRAVSNKKVGKPKKKGGRVNTTKTIRASSQPVIKIVIDK